MKTINSVRPLAAALTLVGSLAGEAMGSFTLDVGPVGTAIYGTGTVGALNVGDYVLYPNAGIDPVSGIAFDLVVRLNAISSNASLAANVSNASLHISGDFINTAVWSDSSLFVAVSGSTSASNPQGERLFYRNLTGLTAKDIDGQSSLNFTDVFGLYNQPAPPVLGSGLVNEGFLGDAGQPTIDVSYVRMPGTSFNGPNVDVSDPSHWATWNYPSATLDEIRFVWGMTSPTLSNLTLRGLQLTLEIEGVSPIPEPSSAFMLGMGTLGLALRRRRH